MIFSWLQSLFHSFSGQSDRILLEQFYSSLESRLELRDPDGDKSEAVDAIQQLLREEPKSWTRAYRAEVKMFELLTPAALEVEFQRRLAEGQSVFDSYRSDFYDAATLDLSEEERESLYLKLLDDLQWRYTVREAERSSVRISKRGRLLVFAISVVIAVAVLQYLQFKGQSSRVILAAVAGLLGGCFSMLLGMKQLDKLRFEQLRVTEKLVEPIGRACIGLMAGVFVYFFSLSVVAPEFLQLARPEFSTKGAVLDAARSRMDVLLRCHAIGIQARSPNTGAAEEAELVQAPTDDQIETLVDLHSEHLETLFALSRAGAQIDVDGQIVASLQAHVDLDQEAEWQRGSPKTCLRSCAGVAPARKKWPRSSSSRSSPVSPSAWCGTSFAKAKSASPAIRAANRQERNAERFTHRIPNPAQPAVRKTRPKPELPPPAGGAGARTEPSPVRSPTWGYTHRPLARGAGKTTRVSREE